MTKQQQKISQAAISLAVTKAGGVTAFAELVGVTRATVYNWTSGNWQISPENAAAVAERLELDRADLRPDLWS